MRSWSASALRYESDSTSTPRTRARPVFGSMISANGTGTMRASWRVISTLEAPASSVFDGAHAEIARVVAVEGGRVAAAQLVADVLLADRHLDAAARERLRDRRAQHARDRHLGQADVAVLVARRRPRRIGSFSSRYSAMPSAITATPSGRPAARRFTIAPSSVRTTSSSWIGRLPELLGDQRDRRAGRLAGAEREVARAAPHHHDEEPAAGRAACPRADALDHGGRVLARGLEAEGRDARRAAADRCRSSSGRARPACGRRACCGDAVAPRTRCRRRRS